MINYRIGEQVTLDGRRFRIRGFSPMGINPRRLYLEDEDTGAFVEVEADDIERDTRCDRGEQNRGA